MIDLKLTGDSKRVVMEKDLTLHGKMVWPCC